ncbi:DUF7117 family protein [Halogeometricum borinquense]|uniref:TFIIB-type zinc ribbon-containing protein n=2 Tax=Halogeometricum borinquense (strain ATCC 700274 / DSM 11551 / JCM 10706 / KCTC 4070 / PR3) TaxID=469382 RepID=E4NSH0_HALBP|nr:zinc ribbon domain-containing protein [Halogeometricum borinquense]ADQ66959.1 hypothetical protein Hbor_13780 [Halogeometricum borinquense DSM 11551]
MEIRGRRRCKSCGHEWSYYDTGEVACPACGSMQSVGIGDRMQHTDSAEELDLAPHRNALDDESLTDVTAGLQSDLRAYLRARGFIRGGDLRDIDDTYLTVRELLHAADVLSRLRDPDEETQLYVLSLLRGADQGERPKPEAVPSVLSEARGLAYAESLAAYRRDFSTWLEDHPDPEARKTLATLGEHIKRVEALQGDVPVEESETLVRTARELAAYARDGDESALTTARDRLSRLA